MTTRRARRQHAKVTNQARNKMKKLSSEGIKEVESGMTNIPSLSSTTRGREASSKKIIAGGKKLRRAEQITRTMRGPKKIKRTGGTGTDY